MAVAGRIKNGEFAAGQFREGYFLKNLIANGSFEASTKWSGVTYETAEHLYGAKCSKLAAGTGSTRMNSQSMPKPVVGHTYYGRHSIKTNGNASPADCRFEWFAGDGAGLNFVFGWNNGNHPDWYTESAVIAVTAVNGTSYTCRNFAVNPNVDIWCDGLMIVDLTEAFGAGKEPDKAWCDQNIPFFEDTYWISAQTSIGAAGYTAPLLEEGAAVSISAAKTTAKVFREVIVLKNLVTGGDMAAGWALPGGVAYDTSRYKYGAQSLKVTAPATAYEMCIGNNVPLPLKKNHTYYGRMEAWQDAVVGGCNIYWPIAEPSFGGAGLAGTGAWNLYSWRVVRNAWEDGDYSFRLDFDNNMNAGTVWYDGVMVIDLTEAFGAGNEPGKAWCDREIPFFNGVKEMRLEGTKWQY